MNETILTQVSLDDILAITRQIIKQEIEASKKMQLEEKFLSPIETCKLFYPPISRQTLDALSKNGTLIKHHLGGKTFFKYSEVTESVKSFKRYKKSDSVNIIV